MLRVFVYGTLKPGERYHIPYGCDRAIDATEAHTGGDLFHLRDVNYPAMTEGEGTVRGIVLSFEERSVLSRLDDLEDYREDRLPGENEYRRRFIEVYTPAGKPFGHAWGYFMDREKIAGHGGIPVPSGWWTEQDYRFSRKV
jgi:gamma-glutamylcyclotransferase (GGCT)/AIG2-like uncharacterized protein YtfP